MKSTDFVQVEHHKRLDSGEEIIFWRNALYIGKQDNCNVVIYTDGTKEVLKKSVPVRVAQIVKA